MGLRLHLCFFSVVSWISLPFLSSLNQEGSALLSFKASINIDPHASLSNWNSSHPDPCSWNGVTCRNASVVSLVLPMANLLGSLSPALASLHSLRHLNLRTNRLLGPLPPQLFTARRIQSLVLYGNSFSGSLPPDIGALSTLQILDLSHNSFSGSLPTTLLSCARLKTLDVSSNNFSGYIPLGFGTRFPSLEKLDLSSNMFAGVIPRDIGNLSRLQGTADFSHNHFSGPIPATLGELPEKVYIDLSYNHLSGAIPQNGALENRGPTAFIGNPGLCGPPLKNLCSSGAAGSVPESPYKGRRGGLSTSAVVAIVLGDIAGIIIVTMVLYYCYRRAVVSKLEAGNSKRGVHGRKDCSCFRKDGSETVSENMETSDLVPVDRRRLGFDLDELLKASAFVLGKSGIGIVYKVVLEDGLTLAVRRLGEGGSQRFKEFQTEVEAIGKVRHPNIVSLRAYYWSIEEKLLIYDYIPNGNLSTAIHGRTELVKFSPPHWDTRLKIIKGIAKGLTFLHEFSPKKYVHGDLKPNNILLGQKMEPYISDFGLARLANIAGDSSTSYPKGTATGIMNSVSYYQDPEALRSQKPSQKWDVYSYGVILLELISGRSPIILLESSEMDLVRWIQFCVEGKKPLKDVLDPVLAEETEMEDQIVALLKIALACVETNPEKRPSMRQIVDTLDRLSCPC